MDQLPKTPSITSVNSGKKVLRKNDTGTSKDAFPTTPPLSDRSSVILTWKTVQSGLVTSTPPLSLNTTNTTSTDDEHDVSNESHSVDLSSSKMGSIIPTKLFGELSELMSALNESQSQNEQKDEVIVSLRAQLASLKMESDQMIAKEKATSATSSENELANAKQSIREKNDLLKSLQTKLLKLNMVTEKTNVFLAEKISELEQASAEITHLQNLVTKYKGRRKTDKEKYDEQISELRERFEAKIHRRDSTIAQFEQQLKYSTSSNSSSRALVSSSSHYYGGGGGYALATSDGPRCKDGSYDMRFKANQGKSKYG